MPWSTGQIQLRDRVGFLRAAGEGEWPDLADEAMVETVSEWLAPFLVGKTKLAEIRAEDLGAALDALLPWHLKRRLDEEAPKHFQAPTGNRHAIDYKGVGAPALHIREQELFWAEAAAIYSQRKATVDLALALPRTATDPNHA